MNDLDLALLLADTADAITRPHVALAPPFRQKFDGSPVTHVDQAVEEALVAIVARERPADGFLGEEVGEARPSTGGSPRSTGGRRWIVDGIDGTAAFIRNRPEWATLIGLEENGRKVVGVVSAPALDARWWAAAGGGAWERRGMATALPMRVSTASDLRSARVGTWPPAEDLGGPGAEAARRVRAAAPDAWAVRESRSTSGDRPSSGSGFPHAALLVAAGALDGVVLFGGSQWDHAALVVICEEAGGRYTDLTGGPRIDTDGGIYSNGRLHDELLAVVGL